MRESCFSRCLLFLLLMRNAAKHFWRLLRSSIITLLTHDNKAVYCIYVKIWEQLFVTGPYRYRRRERKLLSTSENELF